MGFPKRLRAYLRRHAKHHVSDSRSRRVCEIVTAGMKHNRTIKKCKEKIKKQQKEGERVSSSALASPVDPIC